MLAGRLDLTIVVIVARMEKRRLRLKMNQVKRDCVAKTHLACLSLVPQCIVLDPEPFILLCFQRLSARSNVVHGLVLPDDRIS